MKALVVCQQVLNVHSQNERQECGQKKLSDLYKGPAASLVLGRVFSSVSLDAWVSDLLRGL